MPALIDQRLFTTAELAGRLGHSVETLQQWRWQGKGPGWIKLSAHKVL